MRENEFELEPEKTEASLIRRKKNRVKDLGVEFDSSGWALETHWESRKLDGPYIGAPNNSKLTVLAGVAHSIVPYGAPIWHEALRINRNRRLVEGANQDGRSI